MFEHPDIRTLARRSPETGGGGSCLAFDAFIEPYVDDSLETTERARLDAHLGTCAHCRRALDLARRVRSTLQALPEMSCPPEALPNQLAPSITERLAAWWRANLGSPVTIATGAALLVAGLAAGLFLRPTASPAVAHDVAQAEAEVKLAFAYLGRIGARTGDIVAQDVLEARVAVPIIRTVRAALGTLPSEAKP